MSREAANEEPAAFVLVGDVEVPISPISPKSGFSTSFHRPTRSSPGGEPVRLTTRAPRIAWAEGVVDREADHVSLSYGEWERAVALVAPDGHHGFTVQFLLKARHQTQVRADKILAEVRRELTFYLLDVVGPDSWAFVRYHCETPANRLSIVHWTWHPQSVARPRRGLHVHD